VSEDKPPLAAVHELGAEPPWCEDCQPEAARERLEELIANYDRYVIIGIKRSASSSNTTDFRTFRARRRAGRTTTMELIGALYSVLHDWLEEMRDP
jgi:hypothetical protein